MHPFQFANQFAKAATFLREGTFYIGGSGGWAGASDGRVLGKFFYKLGRVKPVLFSTGGGSQFFGKEKISPCRFYVVYTSKATSQD